METWQRQLPLYALTGVLLFGTLWSGAYFPTQKEIFSYLLLGTGALEVGIRLYERFRPAAGRAAHEPGSRPARPVLLYRPAFLLLAALTLLGAASILWSVVPRDSFREAAFLLSLLSVFFVVHSQAVRIGARSTFHAVALFVVFAGAFFSALGIIAYLIHLPRFYTELLDGIYRAGSSFEYSNALSCFALMGIPVAAALHFRSDRTDRPLLALAMSLMTAGVILSYARFGMIALALLAAWLLWRARRRETVLATGLALAAGIAVAAVSTVLAGGGANYLGMPVPVVIFFVLWWLEQRLEDARLQGPGRRAIMETATDGGTVRPALARQATWAGTPVRSRWGSRELLYAVLAGSASLAGTLALIIGSGRLRSIIAARFEQGMKLGSLLPHRLDTYRGALDAFSARPLSGSGLGGFASVYLSYAIASYTKYAHNVVLQFAVDLGIAGAALMALFLLYVVGLSVLKLIRQADALQKAFAIAAIVFVAYNMFDWEWYMPALTAWFVVVLAALDYEP